MRAYVANALSIPRPPDTVITLLMTGGSSAQAMGWPSSAAAFAANAYEIGAHIVRFSGITTAAALNFMVNLASTHAAVPTSGSSVTTGSTPGSTGSNMPVQGSREFFVPTWSTGFSVASLTSGWVFAEVWKV